ncbi:MAG: hypothetical protein K2H43_05720, partial [Clostridia bacterium]|nr:hypothetical protein [Clostridia bacterium]
FSMFRKFFRTFLDESFPSDYNDSTKGKYISKINSAQMGERFSHCFSSFSFIPPDLAKLGITKRQIAL